MTTIGSRARIVQVRQGEACTKFISNDAAACELRLGLLFSSLKEQKLAEFLTEILPSGLSETFSLAVICEFLQFLSIL